MQTLAGESFGGCGLHVCKYPVLIFEEGAKKKKKKLRNYANSYLCDRSKQRSVNQIRIKEGFYFEIADLCTACLVPASSKP